MSDEEPYQYLQGITVDDNIPFGRGGFGDVYKGHYGNEVVAIKVPIHAAIQSPDHIFREAKYWRTLEHDNILCFIGLCKYPDPRSIAFVSPFCDRGDVARCLQRDGSLDRFKLILDVARGISYLHSENIIHGDMKAANVLISDSGTALICDFGTCRVSDVAISITFHGSLRYLAPELIDTQQPDDAYENFVPTPTKKSDIWAFGLVGLEILTGQHPFPYIRNDTAVTCQVWRGLRPAWERYNLPTTPFVKNFAIILEKCWDTPSERPSIETILEELTVVSMVFEDS